MCSASASRSNSSQRIRPGIWASAAGSMFIILASSANGRNPTGQRFERCKRRDLDVVELDRDQRGTAASRGPRERARERRSRSTVARHESGEHRGQACAEVRATKRVVASVLRQEQPFAHEAHAVRTVVEYDVSNRQLVLDCGMDIEAVHEERTIAG